MFGLAAKPAAALAGEGRDDDLVDALVVHGLPGSGVGIRVHDLAVRVDALTAQLAQGAAEPLVGVRVLLLVALAIGSISGRAQQLGRRFYYDYLPPLPRIVAQTTATARLRPRGPLHPSRPRSR